MFFERRWSILLRVLVVLSVSAIVVLSVVPAELRPHTGAKGIFEHFTAYAGSAFLIMMSFNPRRPWQTVVFLMMLAGLLETAQIWVPGRDAKVIDFVMSSAGGAFGTLVGCVFLRLVARHAARRSASLKC